LKFLKKTIHYVLLFALLLSIIPVQFAQPAEAAQANFFIPDDAFLNSTGNMVITPVTNLNRNSAKLSDSGTMSITGTFYQMTGGTLSLKVDLITSVGGNAWETQSGRTFVTAVGSTGNRFSVSGVQLFPGYNRLTFSGSQGGAVKTDVFYVLYDTAPLINKLQITSNNKNYDLNESSDLVLNTSLAYIQGNAGNSTSVVVDGLSASVLSNGLFYAPAMNLIPGLNKFKIVFSNGTDEVTVYRQVYYYSKAKPFTSVEASQYEILGSTGVLEKHQLLGVTPTPIFTGADDKASLTLQFLAPNDTIDFDNTSTVIKINGSATPTLINGTATQTVFDSTYRLVTLTTDPFNLKLNSTPALDPLQPVNINITFTGSDGPAYPLILKDDFSFKLAAGQTIVKDVKLLPGYVAGAAVTDNTISEPFDGSKVTDSEFYVLVNASKPLGNTVGVDDLKVKLMPNGTSLAAVQGVTADATNTANIGQVYKISNLPEGAQTLAFAVGSNTASYSGKITYVSKIYVDLENLFDDQVFTMTAALNTVRLKGKILGFGSNLLAKELKLNGVTQNGLNGTGLFRLTGSNGTTDPSALPPIDIPNHYADNSYDITSWDMPIGTAGPLFIGKNTLRIVLDYTDTPNQALRKYVKEVTFYIMDSDTPAIGNVRPLTPPVGSAVRKELNVMVPSDYAAASPEFILVNGTYTTTLANFDLFIDGSGADTVVVKEGGTTIFTTGLTDAQALDYLRQAPGGSYFEEADIYGNRSNFKIRLNKINMTPGSPHVYTIEYLNASSGAKVNQTLTVTSQNIPYTIFSPRANTGKKIIVNKNFVLFDIEAKGASDVLINGKSATKQKSPADPNRFTYLLTGLKGDTENKVDVIIKNGTSQAKETVLVNYVTNVDVGSMFMEPMSTKHAVFNKDLQLTFPKGTVLRRVIDGKIEPTVNLLFGIADPKYGNTELVNDYNQVIVPSAPVLSDRFTAELGRSHFTKVSEYYWISAGLGELARTDDPEYKEVTGGLVPYSAEGAFTNYLRYADRKIAPTDRGTLTLKFNADVVDQSNTDITVFHFGEDGTWRNIGGEVNIKAKTVEVPFDSFGYYMVGKLKYGYKDITDHTWARNILQALLAKGYMPALRSNEFGASDYINRGEFAALLVRSLGMKLNYDDNNTFIDIGTTSNEITWNYAEIETAARAGIVQGLNDLVFGADVELTRQDAAVMISRALNIKLAVNDDKLQAKIETAFADHANINFYARPAVDALNAAGIMVGTNVVSPIPTKDKPKVNFNPTANMTRAEAGQVSVRLLQKYLKVLPANL
jgi:hypothetical protein